MEIGHRHAIRVVRRPSRHFGAAAAHQKRRWCSPSGATIGNGIAISEAGVIENRSTYQALACAVANINIHVHFVQLLKELTALASCWHWASNTAPSPTAPRWKTCFEEVNESLFSPMHVACWIQLVAHMLGADSARALLRGRIDDIASVWNAAHALSPQLRKCFPR